jgi:hypothetical protein
MKFCGVLREREYERDHDPLKICEEENEWKRKRVLDF